MEDRRVLSEDEARTLRRLAAAHEAFLLAACLRVFDCRSGELRAAYRSADATNPERLEKLIGKYVKRGNGYVRILENGEGGAFAELPDGVTPDEVVIDELKSDDASPLQDRLRELARVLRDATPPDPELDELADTIEAVLHTCRRTDEERCFEMIREWANSDVLSGDGPGDLDDMIGRGYRFFERVDNYAKKLQSEFGADGSTIGAILAIRAIVLARAELAEDRDYEMDALIESILYLAADTAATIEAIASGLAARMVRRGQGKAVRIGAERLKAAGDARTIEALDGDPLTYYEALYPVAAYELGVAQVGQAVASTVEDPEEARRWARFAINAEERAIRVSTALAFASQNLDGSETARHLSWLQSVREKKGEGVARTKAVDLIENQLFYPRAMLPMLLDEADPSAQGERP